MSRSAVGGIGVKNNKQLQKLSFRFSGIIIASHSVVLAIVLVFCLVSLDGTGGRNQSSGKEMTAGKTSFSRKLHLAFGAMLVITLALAWYFYDSVKWFEYDVERVTIANSVLNGQRTLSAQTAQKINLIEESVANEAIADLARWRDNVETLQTAIIDIRQALAKEHELHNAGSEALELEVLNEMERLVEIIVASGEVIRTALEEQRPNAARAELEILRSSGTAEIFDELLAETLAASLNHRIPELHEKEFARLGAAFNVMARQLAEHRTAMRDSNIRLEAIVEERTRALKSSNETLARVDENRRKLLADISHEFRTPLTVIRGESEVALRGKVKTKAEYRETLMRIMEQADQTTRLVDDLLFIARADAGEPRLKIRPVLINQLLSAVCTDFAVSAEQIGIDIRQELGTREETVMGDSGRLRQVFSILIDNALRYSTQNGTVTVSLGSNEQEIVVQIRDTGIGLTEEEARQAFQRFFRGGKAQSHARGTGLGLPVAKAIVEAHKGRISLEGKPGEGALASVFLPAEKKLRAVA
jgi:signal transduction histidine kinase